MSQIHRRLLEEGLLGEIRIRMIDDIVLEGFSSFHLKNTLYVNLRHFDLPVLDPNDHDFLRFGALGRAPKRAVEGDDGTTA
jgi:hypothetical protein